MAVQTATSNLGWQNKFSTTLTSGITSTDTTIALNTLPTPTEGFLVIEPDSATAWEVIYYTSKTGSAVVCPSVATGRGQDDSTAQSHSSGATVRMDTTAGMFEVLQNMTAVTPGSAGGIAFASGWTLIPSTAPNTVTANGNRSYSCVFNGVDLTTTLSAGMRLRTTRTIAAPTQCTSLNGTTQYYSKTSPAGMTFTDDFVVSAWIKLSSYVTASIASRYNGTSGWDFQVLNTGQLILLGYNAGAANYSQVISYQSVPLNKWVHVSAQLDMSAFTATPTTSYTMFDGVDIPASVGRGGTNPTALVQAGNLEIGSRNGGLQPFPGKIAQVAIYSAKVTEANVLTTISQGLAGTETSLISAYSFNNTINDLNANANNLTANGSAVATSADSPFGGQADGTISSTLDYAIIQKTSFSTNTTLTIQVPEGCTIPTTGGVSAVSYSTQKVPYLFPADRTKWRVNMVWGSQTTVASNATFAAHTGMQLIVPIGSWDVGWQMGLFTSDVVSYTFTVSNVSQTGLANTASDRSLQIRSEGTAAAVMTLQASVKTSIILAAAATYLMYTLGASTGAGFLGTTTTCEIFAENTYL